MLLWHGIKHIPERLLNKMMKLPTVEESGVSNYEYDSAVAGLIDKGLVEVGEEDGEVFYYLNTIGVMVAESLDSDPKVQN